MPIWQASNHQAVTVVKDGRLEAWRRLLQLLPRPSFGERLEHLAQQLPVIETVPRQPVFSAADDDQVIRWDDDRELTAAAGGAVGVLREVGLVVGDQAELAAVDTA